MWCDCRYCCKTCCLSWGCGNGCAKCCASGCSKVTEGHSLQPRSFAILHSLPSNSIPSTPSTHPSASPYLTSRRLTPPLAHPTPPYRPPLFPLRRWQCFACHCCASWCSCLTSATCTLPILAYSCGGVALGIACVACCLGYRRLQQKSVEKAPPRSASSHVENALQVTIGFGNDYDHRT